MRKFNLFDLFYHNSLSDSQIDRFRYQMIDDRSDQDLSNKIYRMTTINFRTTIKDVWSGSEKCCKSFFTNEKYAIWFNIFADIDFLKFLNHSNKH